MRMELAGRTALVTGAGTGIGREIALRLLRRGVRVAGMGRGPERLEALGREAEAVEPVSGGAPRFLPVTGDVGREADVRRAADEVRAKLGGVSILVNNAGVAAYAPVAELTVEQWDRSLGTNLRGPFLLAREFLPAMVAAGEGHILNVISVAGIKAFPGCAAYGASKFGLVGLTRVLREETRGTGVRVTALLPGATDTPIWGQGRPEPKRLMPAGAVADAALWALASDPGAVPEEIVLRPPPGDF